jgi:putative transposase
MSPRKRLQRFLGDHLARARKAVRDGTRPRAVPALAGAQDLFRSKRELVAENALLRQQVIILSRQVKKPMARPHERAWMVVLARMIPAWRDALQIVEPGTLLKWHRLGYRLFWRRKSRTKSRDPRTPWETVKLIRGMARSNGSWGAERIRGELLKLGIRVAKRTVQKYMRAVRQRGPSGQKWSTFLENHKHEVWSCDFVQTYDLFFRQVFVLVFIEHNRRRVVHAAATYHPSRAWVAQQARNATFDEQPRFLIRDNDDKFSPDFDRIFTEKADEEAGTKGREIIRTAFEAPRMNAICERFLGSLRRECLDHILILSGEHLSRVVREYVAYHNGARPHQGIEQAIPRDASEVANDNGTIVARPVLGGLLHDYRRAA